MLKKFFSLILLLCISLTVFAQLPQVRWSEEASVFKADKYKPLGFAGNYHYFVRYPSYNRSVLMKYDRHNKLVEEREFKEKINDINLQLIDLIKTTHGNYLFFRGWDKKMKAWHLYAASFNDYKYGELIEFFSYESRYKPIYSDVANNDVYRMNRRDVYLYDFSVNSPDGMIGNSAVEHNPGDRYGLTVSDDKQYVALVEAVKGREKEVICAVFDQQLNPLWKKRIDLSVPARKMKIKQTIVTGDGTVYFLAKNIKDFDEASLPDPVYIVYRIGKDGNLQHYDVKLEGGSIAVEAVLQVPQEDEAEFIVTGLYINDTLHAYHNGSFFISGNAASGIVKVKKNTFDSELIEALTNGRKRKKKRGLHKNYKLKNGFYFPGTSVGFVAELNSVDFLLRNVTGNLLIPMYAIDGTLIRHQSIQKKNRGKVLYEQPSFLLQQVGKRLYLFFNNEKSRTELEAMKGEHRGPYTDMLVMDALGNIESQNCIFNRNQTPLNFSSIFIDYYQGCFLFMGLNEPSFVFGLMQLQ